MVNQITEVKTKNNSKLNSLNNLPQPVKNLYIKGDFLQLLDQPLVAIVGSRKVSLYGKQITYKIASDLAKSGVVIVSGLALGVDSIAHQAAVDLGKPTIAVLPCGIEAVYPSQHFNLANRILKSGGALVSEYPGNQKPMKYQFIARNRIIAALSQVIIITEASAKSGSLHTANFCLEQGKDIFSVPGNITSSLSEGTNKLIKDGAFCLTNTSDILEFLNIKSAKQSYNPENIIEEKIVNSLIDGSQTVGDLLLDTGLENSLIQQTLSLLEIKGVIKISNTQIYLQ